MAKIFTNKQNILLALLILIPLISVAQDRYEIKIDINQFQFEPANEYIRIMTEDKNTAAQIGQPELPVLAYRYYIPSSYPVIGINVVNTVKERLPGEYIIYPAQPESEYDQNIDFIQPDPETYTSPNAFPGMPAEFGGTGFKQGYQIATVSVFPFEYIPSEKALYFYSYIEFEFVYSKTGKAIFKPREDYLTVKSIKSLVENSYMIDERPLQYYSVPKAGQTMTIDSVPCVIITNVQMQQVFEEYAWWKTKTGTRTEVMRVDVIDLIYPGDSLQEKIRNYIADISDCETGQCTQWIILAGDIDIIPAMHVNSNGKVVLTDLYYSNLQGNWNADGDILFGECEWDGDNVDYYSDVLIGRLPCNTANEAQIIVDKLMTYQLDTTIIGHQNKALFISSNMFHDGDGEFYISELINAMPANFTNTPRDSALASTVLNDMSTGQGLIVNYGHSQGPHNFITRYHLMWGPGTYEFIHYYDFDPQNTDHQYSIFLNSTCNNNDLAHPELDAVARHFMISENGGGVGYIGSTSYNSSSRYVPMHKKMLQLIFDSSMTNLGLAMSVAKERCWIPSVSHLDGAKRLGLFSYMYLGDPQMEIWTDEPKILEYYGLEPDSVVAGSQVDISVQVTEQGGGEVEGALVCLTKGYDGVYEIRYTDAGGWACFENIYFPATGVATVVASKSNYFPIEDTIIIYELSPGCPMLYVHNGTDYQLVNNILAQSEDISMSLVNNADYYPIYGAPLLDDNTIKLRIAEDEKERSYIDQIGFSYIYYPVDERVVYTNKNEFRFLSSDSLLPVSAVDNSGIDILEQISSFDNNSYISDQPGYFIVKYQIPAGLPKATDEGGGGIEPPPGGKHNPKLFADVPAIERNKNVMVYALDAAGDWQKLNTLYPRLFGSAGFTDLENMFIGDEITVKIRWNNEIGIDCLPYYFFDGPAIVQQTMIPSAAVHSDVGDISAEILTEDYNEIILSPGEYIDLEFGSIPYQEDHKIAVAFKSYGRYENIDDAEDLGGFTFDQNSPNPFNAATTFSFGLPEEVHVNLTVYNILGQKVIELVDELLPAGRHQLTWNGTDAQGNETASGMYFARFTAGDYSVSRKMMIVK